MLVFIEMEVASANALIAEDAVGGGEFGHDQAASAEILDEAAEDGVGDSGHRGKHGGGSDADVADGEGSGENARGGLARIAGWSVAWRIVPELLHDLILRFDGERA
jgi:hypothetical protein